MKYAKSYIVAFGPQMKRTAIMIIPIKSIYFNVLRLFECYKQMKSLDFYDENAASDSFFAIVRYAVRYVNVQMVNPIEFWSKILSLKEEHANWKPASLLIEI